MPTQIIESKYWCVDRFTWFSVGQGVYLDNNKTVYYRVTGLSKELVQIGLIDLVGLVSRWVSPDRLTIAEVEH